MGATMKSGLIAGALCLLVAAPAALAQNNDPQNTIRMETTKGVVTIALRPDLAPKHAERIKTLARDKFYDNAPFHRVIEGFMAQTGDGEKGNGTGKSKYPNVAAEFTNTPFKRGTVGMARASDPNSANSQFFIVFADAPHLNNQYTVIGQVTSGMEVVDKLKRGEPVRDPDKIVSMRVAADR
jgi:peptidylprolyl isomerase